jgi:CRISPR-associated protein Cas6
MGDGGTAIDMSFALAGTRLPAEYAAALAAAVGTALPWFAGEPLAGIHPLRAAASTQGMLVLARRARLVLRVPAARTRESVALCGRTLEVAGERVTIGEAAEHALAPSGTLYAHRVVTGARDELAFHADVERWRVETGIRCEFISGRPRRVATAGHEAVGFGLALHGLSAADSLRVQVEGIGADRRLGCGIFVPHKAIATPAD